MWTGFGTKESSNIAYFEQPCSFLVGAVEAILNLSCHWSSTFEYQAENLGEPSTKPPISRPVHCKWADVLGVSTPPATDVNFFDINSHSLLVPRLHEQLKATFPEVIKSAWTMAGSVSPERLRYAEVHGSGTPIGDALELEGLTLAMKELGATNHRFTVGSTKGNIGNTQHSSGLVSLIKLCKSIQGGVIPATRGLDTPNPMINPGLPIDLAMQKTPLVESDVLAVSAAGWGGVNSHIVFAFPEERLHKKATTFMPADIFTRQRLEAPRLQRGL